MIFGLGTNMTTVLTALTLPHINVALSAIMPANLVVAQFFLDMANFLTYNSFNTPAMPLHDAHFGGFFIGRNK